MNEVEHDEMRSLLAAYALGAVSEEELSTIRSHLLSCESCMNEADEMAATASSLVMGVEALSLPSGFADGVLEQVRPASRPAPTVRRSWWPRVAALGSALSLTAAAVMGVALIDARNDLEASERTTQTLLAHANMTLDGEGAATAGMMEVTDGSVFIARGLDEAPNEHAYQLWLIENGEPVSAGTFQVHDGIGILETKHSLQGYDAAAVTVEPDSGSEQPTTDPVLASS